MFKKNDIKLIPFADIPSKVLEVKAQLEDERLSVIQAAAEAANNKRIKQYALDTKDYFDGEAGSDGIEEAVLEATSLRDPNQIELTKEHQQQCYETAIEEVTNSFLATYNLAEQHAWVLPQMRAHFGSWKFVDGDGLATIKANCTDDFNRGLWYIAQRPRSLLIDGKITKQRLYQLGEYNNLVPLILSGFKMYQGIAYSRWKRDGLRWVVDKELCDAMLAEVPALTSEEVQRLRNHGLTIRSGTREGKLRDPQTTAMLAAMSSYPDPKLAELPKYALVMLSQIWCAHPVNRSANMVLDPNNWDAMPPPAVTGDIFGTVPKSKPLTTAVGTPWDL